MSVSHVHMENVCTIQLSAELPSSSFEVTSPPLPPNRTTQISALLKVKGLSLLGGLGLKKKKKKAELKCSFPVPKVKYDLA